MNFKLISIILFMLVSTILFASDNNESNVSKDAIFSLNNKVYEKKDFPKEYQNLSEKRKVKFLSQYIYYTLLSNFLEKEAKTYQGQIKDALKERNSDFVRKGITLNPIEKIILDKKVITDTIGYQTILKKHKNINNEIKDFYEKNKKGFYLPKRVEISHIVVKDINLSKKLINELTSKNDLKLFTKYAREYSVDGATKYNGGYVGETSSKQVPKTFFDTLWNAKERTLISIPLKKNGLFHIIYVFKKSQAGQRTLAEEKKNIEKYLLEKEIKKWERKIIVKLKKETKVVYY